LEGGIPNWFTTVDDSIQPHVQLYLLGRLNARLSDYDAALRYADEVERLGAPLSHASLPQDQGQSIRAYVLREQGRYEEALAALEAAPRRTSFWRRVLTPFRDEPQERYLRAELLAELGRYDEALRWLSRIGYERTDMPMRAPAHLLTAQIHERMGAVDSAAVHYKRFIDLWRDCDPELRPQVETAQRALERLTREPTND
jgi:tetratricopeptide (TPR) repeat protein